MAFLYFKNYVDAGVGITTDSAYRDLTQAFIDQQWDNTSAKTPENGGVLTEQSGFGSDVYNEIEAWLSPIVADTSTGLKYPEDFLKLIFKDIDHTVQRGLMYQYNNEHWIAYSYASFDGLPQSVGIRRCNNNLRIIDPNNGSIFSIPCVVDYDMLAPTPQVSRYIITPNSHAVVMVQGNYDTRRLFKLNTRYILGGRPFKLYAYQNAINYSSTDDGTTLLYLDLYLDEVHAKDNIENQIAYNGDYDYSIVLCSGTTNLEVDYTGQFYAIVLLNGKQVNRNLIWKSTNDTYLQVSKSGLYKAKEISNNVIFSVVVQLEGNENVYVSKRATTVASGNTDVVVFLDPTVTTLAQYEIVQFNISATWNGRLYENITDVEIISMNNIEAQIDSNGILTIQSNRLGEASITMNIGFPATVEQTLNFQIVSMMG